MGVNYDSYFVIVTSAHFGLTLAENDPQKGSRCVGGRVLGGSFRMQEMQSPSN